MEQWQVRLFSPYLPMVLLWRFTSIAWGGHQPGNGFRYLRGTHKEAQIRLRVAYA